MNRSDLSKLQQTRAHPAVSILMPTQRRRPGNAEDRIRLRDLLHDAESRLADTYGKADAAAVVAKLEAATEAVDLDRPADGLAIFATRDGALALRLGFPIRERVVLNETFATRDLVRGLARSPRYRVLVLSEHPSRLFESSGDELIEIRAGGFPIAIEGAHGEALASGGYAPHTSRSNEQLRQFFRRVGRSLDHAGHVPLPVVVVGAERDLAYFDEVTTHEDLVIGRVHGNYALAGATELATLVAPVIDEYLSKRRAGMVSQLIDAAGAGRLAVGIDATWRCANEGRGYLLAVEDGYEELPRRVVDGHLELTVEHEGTGVISDVVDHVIETVIERDGDVEFVEPGELGEYGPIALILRW